ncbi:NAD(P)H-dependent flavin oxidoreductase [Shewanella aegiceratis]|uniref:NAD(P)H-dependent flavin oxidoreductase n=1 Tax=Shewanella aegiceratis TaxID=2864203 RepID=UPI001C657853|nr:nitronate monooxygenase [Shewanella aegiceratis]QYJ84201.1 nitronate monooxygenase [Shewanella aegiceratis]
MNSKNFKALLGTELPIIQAPMAGVQDSKLAIAVANAGGLGSIPCGMLSSAQIVDEIKRFRAATSAPLNLNFFCHELPPFDNRAQARWHELLAPYFDELEIAADLGQGGASRMPFNHEIADAIEAFKPEVISFHFGLPQEDLLKRVRSWGAKVISSATTVAEAEYLAARGVDGIIVQGVEAGGHRGMFLSDDVSTQVELEPLLTEIASRVDAPLIAAGGIGDGHGVQAALSMGACAVQVGSAYLLCDEANTSSLHRAAIEHAANTEGSTVRAEGCTALTNLFSGRPARGLVNRAMSELGAINDSTPAFPYATNLMAQLRKASETRGMSDFSPLWCGQNVGSCKKISAGEMTLALMQQVTQLE